MNQQEIDRLFEQHCSFGTDLESCEAECMTKDDFTAAIQESTRMARREALEEAAKVIRNAAQRAVDKEYHKTFALLLMLAGDIDKLKEGAGQVSQPRCPVCCHRTDLPASDQWGCKCVSYPVTVGHHSDSGVPLPHISVWGAGGPMETKE